MENRSKGQNEKNLDKETDKLLPGLDDSATLKCDTCGVKFHDGKTYEKHMTGKKHQKKMAEANLMAKDLAAAAKKSEKEDDDEDTDEEDMNEMHCEVCDKYFSGYIPYTAHIKGAQHVRNTKKQKLKVKLGHMPDVIASDKEDDDTDDDGIIPKPFARCKICQKEFGGPESYKMHLNSAVHKKKEKAEKTLQTLKANHQDDTKQSDDEECFSKCHMCKKSFSGVIPYQIHMKSKNHQKNLEKMKTAEEMKEYWVHDETEPGYVCKECKKVFSDPSGFKSHLANNSHEKQKAKAALQDFLKVHPEIVFVSPFEGQNTEEESDQEGDDVDYYLICKLCHCSFSGPESAQDHLKSSKHLSLKKQKKMKKLKEKAEKTPDKSDDKRSQEGNGKSEKEVSVNDKRKNSIDNNGHDFELI